MSKQEDQAAKAEALGSADRSTSERERIWAGFNRYLRVEASHARKVAKKEQEESERPASSG